MKKLIFISLSALLLLFNHSAFAQNPNNIEQPDKNISRFPIPTVNDLPEDIKETMLKVQEARGFVPNVLFALAHRPEEFRAFIKYNNAIMKKESGLSPAEKEMIIIATSNANGCMYCVMSHGASLRVISKQPTLSDQIAVNYREADISPRQKAMINFAMKVSNDSKSINHNDFETLHQHGFSDEDIWDINAIIAFYGLSNRMMNFAKVRPDEEFYMMGRK
ncbi:peroxidase-related enzyme [Lentimicrobium sp. S6]|uniref:peroxidase-related enzyme n=1 Tax=Lentimicrobium sp. S6 TaxID=2735872 RepID=UPI0015558C9D|nr:peroxidase-related enzyme [Lentimicrobium sp. S6]NPD46940.1 peroxidase-related enzyme [Lentimicrobium sp. S6]